MYPVYIQICSFQYMLNQDTSDMIVLVTCDQVSPHPHAHVADKPSLLNRGPAPAQA